MLLCRTPCRMGPSVPVARNDSMSREHLLGGEFHTHEMLCGRLGTANPTGLSNSGSSHKPVSTASFQVL